MRAWLATLCFGIICKEEGVHYKLLKYLYHDYICKFKKKYISLLCCYVVFIKYQVFNPNATNLFFFFYLKENLKSKT